MEENVNLFMRGLICFFFVLGECYKDIDLKRVNVIRR